VGLCLFTRKGEKELEARPYNVFVFPRERSGYSPQIIIDSSAADFNTKNNMSWDTWFSQGRSFF